jgi:hypothetical protein
MTAELHDRVIKQLDASGAGDPPGHRFHGMTLVATLADEQIAMTPAEPLEIHCLIEGRDAAVPRKTIAELRNTAFVKRPVERLREKIHKAMEKSSVDEPSGSATT